MRECYRMKKMSQVDPFRFFKQDWEKCENYVAKRYLVEGTPRATYFADIEMQACRAAAVSFFAALAFVC